MAKRDAGLAKLLATLAQTKLSAGDVEGMWPAAKPAAKPFSPHKAMEEAGEVKKVSVDALSVYTRVPSFFVPWAGCGYFKRWTSRDKRSFSAKNQSVLTAEMQRVLSKPLATPETKLTGGLF